MRQFCRSLSVRSMVRSRWYSESSSIACHGFREYFRRKHRLEYALNQSTFYNIHSSGYHSTRPNLQTRLCPLMAPPFFTVGIPTYNRESFIRFTLDAILAQSFTDYELLIHDNASTDGTRDLVASYRDPRIRYFRHETNVGPAENFASVAREARGRYVVINQDDDLLHRDFLRRCHDAVAGRDDIAMYAAPAWREERGRGYMARLLRSNEGYDHRYLLQDEIMYMDGPRMATSLLNLTYYFLHPSIAMRTDLLRAAGGYSTRGDSLHDILTEARMLTRGNLAYDSRPGAMYRDHDGNEWKAYPRDLRKRLMGGTLHAIVAELEKAGIVWRPLLDEEFKGYSRNDLERAVREWAWCGAPAALVRRGVVALRALHRGPAWKFNLRLARKLGWRAFWLSQGKEEEMQP